MEVIETRVWMFYLRHQLAARVSPNVLREVWTYLTATHLPCISGTTLRIYDLCTLQSTETELSQDFDFLWTYSWITEKTLLGVCEREAVEIETTGRVEVVQNTSIKRVWPGLARAFEYVFAFGGGFNPPLASCEKYNVKTKAWSAIGSMKTAKCCFSPCRVVTELYLCCLDMKGSPFEAFNIYTETFRDLPVTWSSGFSGSVTFLAEDTLKIVIYEGKLIEWRLSETHLESVNEFPLPDKALAVSNILPMCVGNKVYWVCYSHRLLTYDLVTDNLAA